MSLPVEPHLLAAFIAASFVLLVIPGPTIILVISQALAHGRRVAMASVAGVGLGDLFAATLSLIGVGTVLAASATAFTVIKWIGAAYLVWIGVKMLRSPVTPPDVSQAAIESDQASHSWPVFRDAFLVTLFNPKGIVFFLAFVPQFHHAGQGFCAAGCRSRDHLSWFWACSMPARMPCWRVRRATGSGAHPSCALPPAPAACFSSRQELRLFSCAEQPEPLFHPGLIGKSDQPVDRRIIIGQQHAVPGDQRVHPPVRQRAILRRVRRAGDETVLPAVGTVPAATTNTLRSRGAGWRWMVQDLHHRELPAFSVATMAP